MKQIVVIGSSGTIGSKVVKFIEQKFNVITAGRNSGDYRIDISDVNSIETFFKSAPKLDAVINISGEAKWDDFDKLTEKDYYIGIKSKLMGQVNLVRIGKNFINKGGSFTLTTGILADRPVPMTTSAAMVNGAIHSFIKAAAIELKNDIRINAVSSGVVMDAYEKYKDFFPGHNPIAMDRVSKAYSDCVEQDWNGQIIELYD